MVGVLFLLPLGWILLFSKGMNHKFNTLPYYGPDGKSEVLQEVEVSDGEYYQIPDFELTNHLGQTYSMDSLKGRTWLALFIESDSEHMVQAVKSLAPIHFKYRKEPDIYLVFISNDPQADSPEKLNDFIQSVDMNDRYAFESNKWQYLTGDTAAVERLRSDGFLINSVEESAVLWLVDRDGHLRGRYNPSVDKEMKLAKEDIALLKKEHDVKRYEAEKAFEE